MPDVSRPKPPAWLSTKGSPNAKYGVQAEARRSAAKTRAATKSKSSPLAPAATTTPAARRGKARGDAQLADNARVVLERRYLAKDASGNVVETPDQLFRRVAHNIAGAEAKFVPDEPRCRDDRRA